MLTCFHNNNNNNSGQSDPCDFPAKAGDTETKNKTKTVLEPIVSPAFLVT